MEAGMSSHVDKSDLLFESFRLGDLHLPNRMVMAPLTRNRASHGSEAPNELNATYYSQRAAAGLIITEATQISQEGQGYAWTPGIYADVQVAGWKRVTEAVHRSGGHIFAQLWHVGRVSHNSLQPGGGAPVAPSAMRARTKTYLETGFADVSEPRALSLDEIPRLIRDYEHAARCAREAGFDGVELHAANGYLLDQFMRDGANRRTDDYGGSVENRLRLTLQAADAIARVWPASRIGIRISPVSPSNDMSDSDPAAVFLPLARKLSERGLAYIHVVEGATGGPRDVGAFDFAALRAAFSGAYIANNGYSRQMAVEALAENRADLIAFGRLFLANPDLVERFRRNADLNEPDKTTFYGGGPKGYTDYPTLSGS
jgi:N-ethylmaleimide reductase